MSKFSSTLIQPSQSLQLKESIEIIRAKVVKLIEVLIDLAEEHKDTVTIGRTHGQHALPTTYGMKFAIYIDELMRQLERLDLTQKHVCVGMMTGGEVALIVAQKGLSVGMIEAKYFTAVILLIIASSVITPIVLKILHQTRQGDSLAA